jgi:protein-S-isoprenylcysteine O-methyltransferase Ste14
LSFVSEPLAVPYPLRLAGGFALAALGGIVAVSGALTFRRAGANLSPTAIERGEVLVTSGVFQYTRNPMYLGLALVLCSVAFYLARPVEAVPVVLFVLLLTRVQIIPEERAMLGKFGAAYAEYKRSTRRWV